MTMHTRATGERIALESPRISDSMARNEAKHTLDRAILSLSEQTKPETTPQSTNETTSVDIPSGSATASGSEARKARADAPKRSAADKASESTVEMMTLLMLLMLLFLFFRYIIHHPSQIKF